MIALSGLMGLVIQLVIGGLIFYLIWWFIGWVGLPEPFLKVAKVVLGLVALIFLINLLLGLGGGQQLFRWR